MKRIPILCNAFLCAAIVWFAAALVLRYRLDRITTIAVATALSVGILVVVGVCALARKDPAARTKRAERIRFALLTLPSDARESFLRQILAFDHSVSEYRGGLRVTNAHGDVVVYDRLRYAPLDADTVVACAHAAGDLTAVILADTTDKTASECAAGLGVRISEFGCILELLDKYRAYPRLASVPRIPARTRFVRAAFARSRTRPYVTAAVILLATSFVSPFALWYRIGCIVCCAAAVITLVRRDPDRRI